MYKNVIKYINENYVIKILFLGPLLFIFKLGLEQSFHYNVDINI